MKKKYINYKIYYDNYIFIRQSNGGIKRYFENIIKYNFKNHSYLKNYIKKKLNYGFLKKFKLQFSSYIYPLINNLNKNNKKIYHGTYYLNPFIFLYNFKKVITIHDMIPEMDLNINQNSNKKNLIFIKLARKFSILNSDHIITPTNTTKKDLLSYYPFLKSNQITVINHGIDHFYDLKLSSKGIGHLKKLDFFLYVGSRAYYKGFYDLIDAFSNVLGNFPKTLLICAGPKLSNNELQYISQHGLNKKNILCLQPSNRKLKFLYKFSKAFIYPSSYEGFGFPPLEAIVSGASNVICSSIPSTHEICGNEVSYFPVGNIDFLKELLIKSLLGKSNDNPKRLKYILGKYSWAESTKIHNKVYSDLLI